MHTYRWSEQQQQNLFNGVFRLVDYVLPALRIFNWENVVPICNERTKKKEKKKQELRRFCGFVHEAWLQMQRSNSEPHFALHCRRRFGKAERIFSKFVHVVIAYASQVLDVSLKVWKWFVRSFIRSFALLLLLFRQFFFLTIFIWTVHRVRHMNNFKLLFSWIESTNWINWMVPDVIVNTFIIIFRSSYRLIHKKEKKKQKKKTNKKRSEKQWPCKIIIRKWSAEKSGQHFECCLSCVSSSSSFFLSFFHSFFIYMTGCRWLHFHAYSTKKSFKSQFVYLFFLVEPVYRTRKGRGPKKNKKNW